MKKIMFSLFLLFVFSISSEQVQAAAIPDIQADQKSFDFSTGTWFLSGNVIISTDKWTAKADEVKVHPTQLDIVANGNVELNLKNMIIQADRVEFHQNTQLADLSGYVRISFEGFRATANHGTYHLQTRIANIYGTDEDPASLFPASGGFLKSQHIYFDIRNSEASFYNPVTFELYKSSASGTGIAGLAGDGSYSVSLEKADFRSVTYHEIPNGQEVETDNLSFSGR